MPASNGRRAPIMTNPGGKHNPRIKKDDEIFIDYGKSWDETWADHVDHWEPSSTSQD